jgi:hypothetical protein
MCSVCKALSPVKLELHSFTCDAANVVTGCRFCFASHYIPLFEDVPGPLQGLTFAETIGLRPLCLHQGDARPAPGEIRRHDSMTRLSWIKTSVQERIELLPIESRLRCQHANDFLCQYSLSAYQDFIREHSAALRDGHAGTQLPPSFLLRPYLECAVWPDLLTGIRCHFGQQAGMRC